jgi:hypothetical protein
LDHYNMGKDVGFPTVLKCHFDVRQVLKPRMTFWDPRLALLKLGIVD